MAIGTTTILLACAGGERRQPGQGQDSMAVPSTSSELGTPQQQDSAALAYLLVEVDRVKHGIVALIARSGMDSSHAAFFITLLDRLTGGLRARRTTPTIGLDGRWTYPIEPDTAFVSGLEQWISAARPLPDGQRAAVYIGADELLALTIYAFGIVGQLRDANPAERRLAAIGARIFFHGPDAQWVYLHSWRVEAARFDTGPIGTQALVWKLEHWCDIKFGRGHADEAVGDARDLLSRDVDSPTRALAHFVIADAQLDDISLSGDTTISTDSTSHGEREVVARRTAVDEYRAGIAIDSVSANARTADQQLKELLAGRSPAASRFMCLSGE